MRHRTLVVAVLLAWVVATATWAFRPWPDHVPLVPPDGQPAQAALFECGAPLGERRAVLSERRTNEYPLSRLPCTYRDERRSLAFVNFGLASAGLLLAGWLGVRSRRSSPHAAVTARVAGSEDGQATRRV